jgi:hypothetical protein
MEKVVLRKYRKKWINGVNDGKCECGIWPEPPEQPDYLLFMERAMIAYDRMNIDYPLTGEKIVTGTCMVLFKGDYELCEDVKKYIEMRRIELFLDKEQ